MKNIIILLLSIFSLTGFAQSKVNFYLQQDGSYKTLEGKDYIIIQFEEKSASNIYNNVLMNATSIFNDAKDIINKVEDKQIKIRAYTFPILSLRPLGGGKNSKQQYGGFYQIEFKFKDGRVRVSAPYIEDQLYHNARPTQWRYRAYVDNLFKDGVPKEKQASHVKLLEMHFNNIIESILNFNQTEDDW